MGYEGPRYNTRPSFVSFLLARETTDRNEPGVGVVPICPLSGPPFYITRCCPFTLETIELKDAIYTFIGDP